MKNIFEISWNKRLAINTDARLLEWKIYIKRMFEDRVTANDCVISLKYWIEENVHVSRTGNTVVNKRINRCVVNLNNDLILFDNPEALTHNRTMEENKWRKLDFFLQVGLSGPFFFNSLHVLKAWKSNLWLYMESKCELFRLWFFLWTYLLLIIGNMTFFSFHQRPNFLVISHCASLFEQTNWWYQRCWF